MTVFGSGRTCLRCSKAVDVVKRGRGSELLPHSVGILRGDVFANSFNLRRPSSAPIEENFYCIKSGDRKAKEEEDHNVK